MAQGEVCFYVHHSACGVPAFLPVDAPKGLRIDSIGYDDRDVGSYGPFNASFFTMPPGT